MSELSRTALGVAYQKEQAEQDMQLPIEIGKQVHVATATQLEALGRYGYNEARMGEVYLFLNTVVSPDRKTISNIIVKERSRPPVGSIIQTGGTQYRVMGWNSSTQARVVQIGHHPWVDDTEEMIAMLECLTDLPCVIVNAKRQAVTGCCICKLALEQREIYWEIKDNQEKEQV